jgi:tetratricopeptide (TPR) repeat protein
VAIEKTAGAAPKMEWTMATIVQLAASGVLVLLSLLFGWLAFSNWRFKSNLIEGYEEVDRGRPLAAKAPLEAALSWRKDHAGARELLAKLLCDEDKLDDARKEYLILKGMGHAVPQVHVGLGVITLKEAESLDKSKVEALVKEAEASFKSAAGTPEAEIGLGHCELVLARKLNDPAHYAKAQAIFAKIRGVMDQKRDIRAEITRDGLVDYYAGLGKALSGGEKVDDGAREAFRACVQYLPASVSVLPLANLLSLEARRFAAFSEGNDALLKLQAEAAALRNQTGSLWRGLKNQSERERLREPWMMYSLALAQAWGRAGNTNEMQSIVRDLASAPGLESRLEPAILEAMVRAELAVQTEQTPAQQEAQAAKAQQTYNELIAKLPADDANRENRVRAYNNQAWMLAFRGGYSNSEAMYTPAVQKLNEALRLAPDDYIVNRNLAIVHSRFKKPLTAPSGYLEKCRAAAEKDKQWAEDFEILRKVLEKK